MLNMIFTYSQVVINIYLFKLKKDSDGGYVVNSAFFIVNIKDMMYKFFHKVK